MKFRARVYNLQAAEFDQRVKWCCENFGAQSHSRWWPKYCYEIRFTYEEDLAIYLLRWS